MREGNMRPAARMLALLAIGVALAAAAGPSRAAAQSQTIRHSHKRAAQYRTMRFAMHD